MYDDSYHAYDCTSSPDLGKHQPGRTQSDTVTMPSINLGVTLIGRSTLSEAAASTMTGPSVTLAGYLCNPPFYSRPARLHHPATKYKISSGHSSKPTPKH